MDDYGDTLSGVLGLKISLHISVILTEVWSEKFLLGDYLDGTSDLDTEGFWVLL